MSLNPATQNVENLGNSAETLRLGFRAFDLKFFAHDSIGKTMLVVPRPCFAQLHSPAHHANSSCLQLPPRTSACLRSNSAPAARMEQSRNNARAKTPSFTASPPKQCSIDFHFSFARHSRKLNSTGNSRVTIPLTKHLFFQPVRSGIATASGDNFITRNNFATVPIRSRNGCLQQARGHLMSIGPLTPLRALVTLYHRVIVRPSI